MALSGTLDTFALPDVLRLCATTAKSGRLCITGDRGSGSVWMEDGDVVATELFVADAQSLTSVEVIFGLLRFVAGSFTFESEVRAAEVDHPSSLEPILTQAENMLVEWRSIEQVVPSLDVWVGLVAVLAGADVMIDANRWSAIAAVGSGAQVGAVAETLELSEIDACRAVKELVELGLVEVLDEPVGLPVPASPLMDEPSTAFADDAGSEHPGADGIGTETSMVDEMFSGAFDGQPIGGLDAPSFATPAQTSGSAAPELSGEYVFAELRDPIDLSRTTDDIFAGVEHNHRHDPETISRFASDELAAAATDESDLDDLNPAEMARQLANLSPKAAKAVAAAAKASTDVERDAALAAVEAEDATFNRGLLLKFLGSVDS